MPYTPFAKPTGQPLQEADLSDLITNKVAEGYYVEYKGKTFPSNDKIGHSIASFANTAGGWYIVGVETDGHNVAQNIPGFSAADFSDPTAKVRDIAKSHISPMPVVFLEVVTLSTGRLVLVVQIPGMQEAPFITKDGRVYRRRADSSEPILENDRYAFDRLIEQGREVAKTFERFCTDDREFSKGEKDQGWLKVFMSPYPLGTIARHGEMLSSEGVAALLELSKQQLDVTIPGNQLYTANIPFNVGVVTPRSVILRQVNPLTVTNNSLSIELYTDGRVKFLLPLPYVNIEQSTNYQSDKVIGFLYNYNKLETTVTYGLCGS